MLVNPQVLSSNLSSVHLIFSSKHIGVSIETCLLNLCATTPPKPVPSLPHSRTNQLLKTCPPTAGESWMLCHTTTGSCGSRNFTELQVTLAAMIYNSISVNLIRSVNTPLLSGTHRWRSNYSHILASIMVFPYQAPNPCRSVKINERENQKALKNSTVL